MGILRRIAGDSPPKASDPLEVAGEGTDPTPDDADNSDIADKAGESSLSTKYCGKKSRVIKAVIAAVAVIVVCGARYIMSGRSISYLKTSKLGLEDVSQPSLDDVSQPSLDDVSQPSLDDTSQLPLDDNYMDDFNEAAEEIEAYSPSELAVSQAFQLHFTPSLEDGQSLLGDPLTVIKDHVAKMRECTVPPASSLQARLDFAQHLQLLRSICRTVALRFKDLEVFNTVNQKLDVANPFLVSGGGEDYNNSDAPLNFQEVTGHDWTASELLEFFGLSRGGKRRVNGTLAKKLKLLLDIEKRHNDTNLNARYHFTAFLQPFEGDGVFNPAHAPAEHQIPYTGEPFRTGAFAEAAAQIFGESDATTYYAYIRKLNRIADNWTNEGVAAAVKQQEKENADNAQTRLKTKRELMRGLLSQGIPEDDLVMIALFLL
ncbi:uncharacterized protein EMH_0005170 [Eimeria mitis]|uniref:Uncharacterized protein n=1 Tax=Eimeria mitis TaxID=44415 RepID=U6JX33_9EIME|nr:uncharacterized protein EMH_0005170 [Eimeria mitis]CDJ29964.1 hypothetical protein EMH_0005170 [Eimeria mitis]